MLSRGRLIEKQDFFFVCFVLFCLIWLPFASVLIGLFFSQVDKSEGQHEEEAEADAG